MLVAICLTWLLQVGEPVRVDADPGARQPQVAIDGHGRIYITYGVGDEVRCATSEDGGHTFGEPVVVARVPRLMLGMRRGPRIAATDRAVVIAAVVGQPEEHAAGTGKHYGSARGDLVAWRSADGGRTWSEPTRLNAPADSGREGLHALAARPDGTLFCAWLDMREGAMALYGARSTENGATWEADRLVYRSPEKEICTCCHPSLAFGADGRLFVLWRNSLDGSRDMYMAISENDGATFGEAVKQGRRTWILAQCPMDGGAVAPKSEGNALTIWMRAGEVYKATAGEEDRLGSGVQPWAASNRDGAHIVWLAARPGVLRYLAPGASTPRDLATAANDPVIAASPTGNGPVIAAWESTSDERGIVAMPLRPTKDVP